MQLRKLVSDLISLFNTTKCPYLSKNEPEGFLGILCHVPKVDLSCKSPDPWEVQLLFQKKDVSGLQIAFHNSYTEYMTEIKINSDSSLPADK